MPNNILDLMSQKALAEQHVGEPNKALAAIGGIYAQCKKELPAEDFEKILQVSGVQANLLVKKFDGMSAEDAWKTQDLDPAQLKDFVHECTTIIRQASQVDASKALAPVA